MTRTEKFDKSLSPRGCTCIVCRPSGYKRADKMKHDKIFYDDLMRASNFY